MRSNEARIALDAAREWESKGMFKPGAFTFIEKSLAAPARETGLAMQSFFVIGGILLGAATAALYALLLVNEVLSDAQPAAWVYFLICAMVLLSAGVGVHLTRQKDLGDALTIAGMVPLSILLGPEIPGDQDVLRIIPFLGALGLVAWRRHAHLVPLLGLGLATAAWPIFVYRLPGASLDAATGFWVGGALCLWGGAALWNHLSRLPYRVESAALTTLSLGAAWVAMTVQVIQPEFDGGHELIIGLVLGALIGAGIALRQQGIIFAAAGGLTLDAIVFAFAYGGPTIGLVTLLGLAGALIAAAVILRARRAATT